MRLCAAACPLPAAGDNTAMEQVILFSGGLDSVCAAQLHPDAALVYIDYGGRYCNKERRYVHETAGVLNRKVVSMTSRINLQGTESGEGAFLPNRNALLILMAATCFTNLEYSNETSIDFILNATGGGIHPDKDETFAHMLTNLMNYMNRGGKDSPKREYRVLLPTKHLTKPEIVATYINAGGLVNALFNAVSCYDAHQRQCGRCRACIRKYVALAWNGIQPLGFSNSPRKQFDAVRERCLDHTWCSNPKEEEQTLKVINER